MFWYHGKVLFSVFFQFKGDFVLVRGQNNWKLRDWDHETIGRFSTENPIPTFLKAGLFTGNTNKTL